MPSKVNRKCQTCAAKWETADAEGRECWVAKTCRSRRSYYRNRAKRLVQMAQVYDSRRKTQPVEVLKLPPLITDEPVYSAALIEYGHKGGKVHAIDVVVYKNSKPFKQAGCRHTKGIASARLTQYWADVAGQIKRDYNCAITKRVIESPKMCPLCREGER